jgi:hypothetical protein
MWGALSDERTRLPFTIAAGPRQRSDSWVLVPGDSFQIRDSTTVEVFVPAAMRGADYSASVAVL